MHPQPLCKPRRRPVTHFQPINRSFVGFFSPANIGAHLARVEVSKTGLAGDLPVVVVVEALRPAQVVRGFAHASLEGRTRLDEVVSQRRTFLFAVARDLIPAYMAVRVAVKFERPRA